MMDMSDFETPKPAPSFRRPEVRTFSCPDSSNVKYIAFDDISQTLLVQFINGAKYRYENCDAELYEKLRDAESVGHTLNREVIKKPGRHPYHKA